MKTINLNEQEIKKAFEGNEQLLEECSLLQLSPCLINYIYNDNGQLELQRWMGISNGGHIFEFTGDLNKGEYKALEFLVKCDLANLML